MLILRRVVRVVASLLALSILLIPVVAIAATAPALATPPGLSLAEIKITGNEFIMLQNNTSGPISDLSQYWLYGFNATNPLSAGVNSSSQQLPPGSLGAGQTVLLSQGGPTCGAAMTSKLSISLTDSGGYLEVVKTEMINGVLAQTAGDAVSWSSGTNSVTGMISKVPSNTAAPNGAWYRIQGSVSPPTYKWQQADVDSANTCLFKVVVSGTTVSGPSNPGNQLLPGTPPPATIVSFVADSSATTTSGGLPPSDVGLKAPVLNEILPNPASPQTDTEDEFIEIYNPNNTMFDLSGFKLQAKSNSSSTKHTYTFPNGTKIAANSFAAYPSSEISISLTNSGAQVWLLEPGGSIISKTDPYSQAKSGFAWALAKGKWYWTASPTPNAPNIISGSKAAGGAAAGNGIGTVKGASTSSNDAGLSKGASSSIVEKATPLHAGVLVGVGCLAILYGLYEYRHDIANWIYKFKRNRTTRQKIRQIT